ncbi:multimerin-2 isoform X2 [Rhinatrema bivittatum]|uniref:multimerin-2 isoform X2 n=1 Tax=Rhinatrema bivittatum TaxID=194408 RepID=UPI00112ABB85|nr:multimerin-2 isoform X2 [Rhinatrema bivittatum]
MMGKLFLVCYVAGLVEVALSLKTPLGYNSGTSLHHSRPEAYGVSKYPYQALSYQEGQATEEKENLLDGQSSIYSQTGEGRVSTTERPGPRRGNWCSFVQSKLVTYVASCKTEKYIVKSQQLCPQGVPGPECQKVMYRVAQKPVYQVKQKILTSLEWKCCPGHTGTTCEQNASPAAGTDGEQERPSTYAESTEIIKTIHEQESLLEDLQNDIHQATFNLKALEENITIIYEANQNTSGSEDQLLQHVLLPHIESFLRELFNPMWTNFNKSLQTLSSRVQNLSQNIETNRKSIEKLQEITAPKKDLQEVGSKFESKIQENIVRVEQLKRELDSHLYSQQAGLHLNLTMLKADTDMKLKRNHKMHQAHFASLNSSIADVKREQENLLDEIQTLNRNITELWLYYSTKDGQATQMNAYKVNETLAAHAKQIKELYLESDAAFENISTLEKWIKTLRTQLKTATNELQVSLIEKSLIMEENKEVLQKQLMDLNYTIISLEERNQDLLDYIKNCECQRLSSDISILEEDQRNITKRLKEVFLNLEELNQTETNSKRALQNSVEDLSMVLQSIHQSLALEQEQGRNIMHSVTQFKAQVKNVSADVLLLKNEDEVINSHIKNLKSIFNSLLEDASRHDRALVALLGDDIIEVLSEENPEALKMSVSEIHEILNDTSRKLEKQHTALEILKRRVHVLEVQIENNSDSPESSSSSELGNQVKIISEESSSKQEILEYMEPNHEAASEDILDNPAYNDILTLKKDIKHFSLRMKNLEMLCADGNFCCNNTVSNLVEPLNASVEMLRVDLMSFKQLFDKHQHLFQKLFGNNDELVSSNISLDITKYQSLIMEKLKRHQRVEEHRGRDKKQTGKEGLHISTFSKQNKLSEKLFGKDSSVAFYAGLSDGANHTKVLQFNELYLNYGKGYFPEGGVFKAPYSGVYMFVISVEFGSGPAVGQLVLGSQQNIMLYASKKKQLHEGLTRFAVVQLKEAEEVWFELMQGSVVKRSPPGTVMGGFLIFKT